MSEFAAHFDADTQMSRDVDGIVERRTDRGDTADYCAEPFEGLHAATGRRPNNERIENTSLALDHRGAPRPDHITIHADMPGDSLPSVFCDR
ncbi:hypothetical protein [uncultured Roseobacter sp.]|uniref:hypothetical protein n=1 Tax=uncultured Roseobacter sp. TaxID=114847 RepID=UPI002631F1B6|nr:hypothetical protein [uncultured Roseobacter sp.]